MDPLAYCNTRGGTHGGRRCSGEAKATDCDDSGDDETTYRLSATGEQVYGAKSGLGLRAHTTTAVAARRGRARRRDGGLVAPVW